MVHQFDFSETPFNMAMLFYEELHQLRILKSKAYIEGNMIAYRDALEEIYTAISFKLKKDKQKTIQESFISANHLVAALNPEAKAQLKEIDIELINLMHLNHMIFPKMEKGGLGQLKKSYGIEDVKE